MQPNGAWALIYEAYRDMGVRMFSSIHAFSQILYSVVCDAICSNSRKIPSIRVYSKNVHSMTVSA